MTKMAGFVDFNPDKDIPSLKGRVLFITGGCLLDISSAYWAYHISRHCWTRKCHYTSTCQTQARTYLLQRRNKKAGESLIADIDKTDPSFLTFLEMDLTSLSSVKAASQKFAHKRLDVLICNAGIMAAPPALSKDGYEIQFATNHLGHAMLIQQLLLVMLETTKVPGADVRIVCLSSDGWGFHPKGGVRFSELKTVQEGFYGAGVRYG
jgi:NAD(P)-dependent dehydrogenase (short-subunit alcohol dehydrogenase family)